MVPQVDLLIAQTQPQMVEDGFERCAADLLARAAANPTPAQGHPLATAAVSGVACRRVGRGRVASGLVASGGMLLLVALFCVRLAAAFLPLAASQVGPAHSRVAGLSSVKSAPLSSGPVRAALPRAASRGSLAVGRGPAMCSPVPTAVDPAVAAVLLNVCFSRAASDLRQLRFAVADARDAPAAAPKEQVGWLREAAQSAKAVQSRGVRGTATLLRTAATDAVRHDIA